MRDVNNMECEVFSNAGNSLCVLDIYLTGRESQTLMKLEVIHPYTKAHYHILIPSDCYIIPVEFMLK